MRLKVMLILTDNEAPEGTPFQERKEALKTFFNTDAFDGLDVEVHEIEITEV